MVRARLQGSRDKVTWAFGDVDDLPVRSLDAVRKLPRGRRDHLPRLAYCGTTHSAAWVESALEHHHLRCFDRDPSVAWIVAQPLQLRIRVNGRATWVAPDFLIEDTDGNVGLREVKPAGEADKEEVAAQLEATAKACTDLGWSFEVLSEPDRQFEQNLMFLEVFRRPVSWSDRIELLVLAELDTPRPLQAVLDAIGDEPATLPVLWNMLWRGALEADLSVQIEGDSLLAQAAEATP